MSDAGGYDDLDEIDIICAMSQGIDVPGVSWSDVSDWINEEYGGINPADPASWEEPEPGEVEPFEPTEAATTCLESMCTLVLGRSCNPLVQMGDATLPVLFGFSGWNAGHDIIIAGTVTLTNRDDLRDLDPFHGGAAGVHDITMEVRGVPSSRIGDPCDGFVEDVTPFRILATQRLSPAFPRGDASFSFPVPRSGFLRLQGFILVFYYSGSAILHGSIVYAPIVTPRM